MKNIIRGFIFIALISSAALALDFGPSDITALVGAVNVSVPFVLNNNVSVTAFEFEVNHSSYLKLRDVVLTSRLQNASIIWNNVSATKAVISVVADTNITAGNGTILNLKFDVDLLAVPGAYAMKLSNGLFTSLDINTIPVSLSDSIFTIL